MDQEQEPKDDSATLEQHVFVESSCRRRVCETIEPVPGRIAVVCFRGAAWRSRKLTHFLPPVIYPGDVLMLCKDMAIGNYTCGPAFAPASASALATLASTSHPTSSVLGPSCHGMTATQTKSAPASPS